MKPTRVLTLIAIALLAGGAAFLWATYSVSHGREIPVSGFNLMFSLPAVSVVLVILAWPIYRYRRELNKRIQARLASANQATPAIVANASEVRPKRIDPFYAVRVLLLAKATAVAGALFTGWHLGTAMLQLGAPVISNGVWFNLATMLGSILATAVALWVESICKIPDDPDETAKSKTQLGGAADPALGRIADNKHGRFDHRGPNA